MLDLPKPFNAKIEGLKLVVREEGPLVNRYLRFKIQTVLDVFLAEGLGPGASLAWAKVRDGSLTKVELLIDAIRAKGVFVGPMDKLAVEALKGVKVVIVPGAEPESEADEDPDPIVTAEWEGRLSNEALLFFGWNAKNHVEVKLERQNPELPHVNAQPAQPPPAGGLSPKARSAAEARLATLLPFGPVDPDQPDLDPAQLAESPEEAEEIRASRRGEDEDSAEPTDPPESADPHGDDTMAF